MVGMTESLTVQILADGSQFQQELNESLDRLRQFQQQMQDLGRSGNGLSNLGNSLRRMLQPLSQVSSLLTRVTGQIQQLNGMSISINVEPALQALARLSAAAQQTAAQIQAIQGMGAGTGTIAPFLGAMGNTATSPRQFSRGGLVTGAAGVDRVPAMLTAGEFVLQKRAVESLGRPFLEQMNQGRKPAAVSPEQAQQTNYPGQAIHQYGEINIHVNQPLSLNDLVRDLQFEGHRLKNRRG